jgi:hypothetical protein
MENEESGYSPGIFSKKALSEEASINILKYLLISNRIITTGLKEDDKTPNHDGTIDLVNEKGQQIGAISVSVKTLNQKNSNRPQYSLDLSILKFAQAWPNPFILIVVDQLKEIAYWKYIDADFIEEFQTANKEKIEARHQKYIQLLFSDEDVISKSNYVYIDKWEKILENFKERAKSNPIKEQDQKYCFKYRNIEDLFVKLSMHDEIKESLKENHFTMIEGLPKIGKSFTLRKIGLELHDEGYNILEIGGPEDIKYCESVKQAYICDDILGDSSLDRDKFVRWKTEWSKIVNRLDEQHLLLCTTRSLILKEMAEEGEDTLFRVEGKVPITQVDIFEEDIKREILEIHFRHSKLNYNQETFEHLIKFIELISDKIVELESFFPEDVRLLFWQLIPKLKDSISYENFYIEVLSFFNRSNSYLQEELSRLSLAESLVLLFVYSNKCQTYIELKEKCCQLSGEIASISENQVIFSEDSFGIIIDQLAGVYIDWIDFYWIGFSHPSIKESFGSLIRKEKKWLEYMKLLGGTIFIKEVINNTVSSQDEKTNALKIMFIDEITKKSGNGSGDLRNIGELLRDLRNVCQILQFLKDSIESIYVAISSDTEIISMVNSRLEETLAIILQNYIPEGIRKYNQYGSLLSELLDASQIAFESYNDDKMKEDYARKKIIKAVEISNNDFWETWPL